MDVHVEIQGRPEPLDDDHGAATPARHTLLARAPAQAPENASHRHAHYRSTERMVPRSRSGRGATGSAPTAGWELRRARGRPGGRHARPCGANRSSDRTHVPCTRTGRAGPARSPRSESAQSLRPAIRSEEVAKLPLDKPRHAVSITQSGSLGKERLEVIAHDPIKHTLGWRSRLVVSGRTAHAAVGSVVCAGDRSSTKAFDQVQTRPSTSQELPRATEWSIARFDMAWCADRLPCLHLAVTASHRHHRQVPVPHRAQGP